MFLILAVLIAFLAIMLPGLPLALVLLRKTELNLFEIVIIGFVFGFMAPAILTWLESYLISFSSFFSFSLGLFAINTIVITIIGLVLCWQQGVLKNFKQDFLSKEQEHERGPSHRKTAPQWWVWALLLILMITTFATRMQSIVISTKFFEFDPYFDMIDTGYILTYGQQLLLDPSAWPAVPGGTNHRIEPLIPYVEAFWYDLSNTSAASSTSIDTNLLSLTGGIYPPIAAALLVFIIFVLIYHEYNEYVALIGAGLTASMPVLFTTFIAGEQLVEPWGIFALFFFLAAYMLSAKNPKNTRLAVFAGLAFVANFLGAHYYTVTTGVFVIYLLLQGLFNAIRGESDFQFLKTNAIIIAVIAIFYVLYLPYSSTLQNRIPNVLGVPVVLSGLIIALAFVAVLTYAPKLLRKYNLLKSDLDFKGRLAFVAGIVIVGLLVVLLTPLGKPIYGYLALSQKFTTPSSPLFMTVEEYIPTGLMYNFGAQGFGTISPNLFGIPLLLWIIVGLSIVLIAMSIIYRNSKTGILYMAMVLPLAVAGFSEVKYLPHFGVAYILMFCIVLGEAIYYAEGNFKIRPATHAQIQAETSGALLEEGTSKNNHIIKAIYAIGLFFLSTIAAIVYLLYVALNTSFQNKNAKTYLYALTVLFIVIIVVGIALGTGLNYGESGAIIDSFAAGVTYGSNPTTACTTFSNSGDSLAYTLYCNTIQPYWLNAMSWIKQNVGPTGSRVLSWWDYGDWINWFGNSNAFLRGDNANATEDYATAAHYVLGNIYGPNALANFMNGNQSKYVLFDQDLISKWQALDFLGCIYTGGTSYNFAVAQGASQSPPQPYVLGTSTCELQHDPELALIPLSTLIQTNSSQSNIGYYCSLSNTTQLYVNALLVVGSNFTNQTACVNIQPNAQGVLKVYNSKGQKLNAYIQSAQYQGIVNVQGVPFVEYLMIYVPNAANGTITNAPSGFYSSNYYKGFILGNLPGFTEAYPANAVGINYINGTWPIRIYSLNNFTGTLPAVPKKPSYIKNNYTMP